MARTTRRPTGDRRTRPQKYTMRIETLTVEHLGIKLYDKVSAVLSELIANAYDADATLVTITLPLSRFLAGKAEGEAQDKGLEIRIEDDGCGMTADEVNHYYLRVGFNRRIERGEVTPRGRMVMGRKGIGKLAPFGICNEIEVISAGGRANRSRQYEVADLILRLDDMLGQAGGMYHPQPGPRDGQRQQQRGTTIVLRDFKHKRVPGGEDLNRQIAARFGIARPDWRVRIINSDDPTQTFEVGELPIALMEDTRIDVREYPVEVSPGKFLPVAGWIAYAKVPYKDEAMSGVRVFARGKLVAKTRDFEIQSGFTGEFKLRSYLVGEIHADWLDEDEDLIQSHRQDIIWNSGKGEALRVWGQKLIKELAARAETNLRETTWSDFLEASKLEETVGRALPKDPQFQQAVVNAARALVRRADREAIRNDPDYVQSLVNLAFSIAPHTSLLSALNKAADADTDALETVITLFEQARVAEMYSLGQIADERLRVIARLDHLIRASATEEVELQKLIEEAPWVLNPAWTPLTMTKSLENVRRSLEIWFEKTYSARIVTSAIDHPGKIPDFVLLDNEGYLEIVEIKRPDHKLTDEEFQRILRYLLALRKFMEQNPEVVRGYDRTPHVIIVCDRDALSEANRDHLDKSPEIRMIRWEVVLAKTRQAHADFLEVVKRMQGRVPIESESATAGTPTSNA